MSEKQLWQIGWQGGQTDGDTNEQTVRELLNVEIDTPGVLKPRGNMTSMSSNTLSGTIDVKNIIDPSDPSNTLLVVLTTTSVRIKAGALYLDTLDFADAEGGGVASISANSTMVVHGHDIYVAALDASTDEPIGVFHVGYVSSEERFTAPYIYDATAYDASESVSGWYMVHGSGDTPDLNVAITYNGNGGFAGGILSYTLDADMTTANDVGLAIDLRPTDIAAFQEPERIAFDYCVQYVYRDGSHSKLSNVVTIYEKANELSNPNNTSAAIVTVCVNPVISISVSAINIYRRVGSIDGAVEQDKSFDLLETAYLYCEDMQSISDESSGGLLALDDIEIDGGTTITISGTPDADGKSVVTHEFTGTLKKTAGWLNYDTNVIGWVPESYIASGDFSSTVRQTEASSDYYKWDLTDAVFVIPMEWLASGIIGSRAMFAVNPTSSVNSVAPTSSSPDALDCHDVVGALISFSAGNLEAKNGAGAAVVSALTPVSLSAAFIGVYDVGDTLLLSANEVIGAEPEDVIDVLPSSVAIAAGRMICLNSVHDGQRKPARLSYSEFRKYGTFLDSNYIDFGPRDDGVGVSLAYFAGRLLVLHSTSSYIIDISSGSDVSWREIGAFNDIGCLTNRTVVRTSVGVFFGDSNDCYYFDGMNISKLTRTPYADVRASYQSIADEDMVLSWRGDKRQLWVSNGRDVLVYDFDLRAWHKHSVSTIEASAMTDVVRFVNVGGVEQLVIKSATLFAFYKFVDTDTTCKFQWGLTTGPITMGSSEFIKKLKSIYLDFDTSTPLEITPSVNDSQGFSLWYGDQSGDADVIRIPAPGRTVEKVRGSDRSYYLNLKVQANENGKWVGDPAVWATGASYWKAAIESFGLSYKPKKLK